MRVVDSDSEDEMPPVAEERDDPSAGGAESGGEESGGEESGSELDSELGSELASVASSSASRSSRASRASRGSELSSPGAFEEDADPAPGGARAELFHTANQEQPAAADLRRDLPAAPSVESYPDYSAELMGQGVEAQPPIFDSFKCSNFTQWMDFRDHIGPPPGEGDPEIDPARAIVPVRAICMNVPAELFQDAACKLCMFRTPADNKSRAAKVLMLLEVLFSVTGKGWLSGKNHFQVAKEGNAEQKEESQPELSKVDAYLFSDPVGRVGAPLQQFVFGYEEVVSAEDEKVEFVRFWKLTFDRTHSTSELVARLLSENAKAADEGRASSSQVLRRSQTLGQEARARGALAGTGTSESVDFERNGANQWLRCTSLRHLADAAHRAYSGGNSEVRGKSPFDAHPPASFHTCSMERHDSLDSTHPLCPSYVFNAKRPSALRAGLVRLEEPKSGFEPHPDQVDASAYWRGHLGQVFQPPESVLARGGFFLLTDPFLRNLLDAPFPRPLGGQVSPGPALLDLFREAKLGGEAVPRAKLRDLFVSFSTGRDADEAKTRAAESSTTLAFDSYAASADERGSCARAAEDASDGLVEKPRRALLEIVKETERVLEMVNGHFGKLRAAAEARRAAAARAARRAGTDPPALAEAQRERAAVQRRFAEAMREAIEYKAARMRRMTRNPVDREATPNGWKAVADGLDAELKDPLLNGSANVASALGFKIGCSRRTAFGMTMQWMGTFFEREMNVYGRDYRVMFELVLTAFEQFTDITLLLLICGEKGNGKSLRCARTMRAFVEGWFSDAGGSSSQAKSQGHELADNGRVLLYDEMLSDIQSKRGAENNERVDEFKEGLLKREVTRQKTVAQEKTCGATTTQSHVSKKLTTPWDSCHVICTNQGPAMRAASKDPSEISDTFSALIDRSVVVFTRKQGNDASSDAKLEQKLKEEEPKAQLTAFRVLTCLVGLTRMLLWKQHSLAPDEAFALRLFAEWDDGKKGLKNGFCLPTLTPRKKVKRQQNLTTLTAFHAVSSVFLWRQTARGWECARREGGRPQPFRYEHLYHVLQAMHPTPEVAAFAWSLGLEYNVGTSTHGFNVMTALAEHVTQKTVGQMFGLVPAHQATAEFAASTEEVVAVAQAAGRAQSEAAEEEEEPAGGKRPRRSKAPRLRRRPPPPDAADEGRRLPSLLDPFSAAESEVVERGVGPEGWLSKQFVAAARREERRRREARGAFRVDCRSANFASQMYFDPDTTMRRLPQARVFARAQVGDAAVEEGGGRGCDTARGAALARRREPPPEGASAELLDAFRRELGLEPRVEDDLPEVEPGLGFGNVPSRFFFPPGPDEPLPLRLSLVLPTPQEATLLYPAQTLAQWSSGRPAELLGEPLQFGTNSALSYVDRRVGDGNSAVDFSWLRVQGAASYKELARCLFNTDLQRKHIQGCDMHVEGVVDVLWLMCSPDNARVIGVQPYVAKGARPHVLFKDVNHDSEVTESTVAIAPKTDRLFIDRQPVDLSQPERLHPGAGRPDSALHRSVAQLARCNLLPALTAATISPCLTLAAPLVEVCGNFRVSSSALLDHFTLVKEAVSGASCIPGCADRQEDFSNQACPEMLAATSMRDRGLDPSRVYPEDSMTKLSYAVDTLPLYISSVAAEMLVNDAGERLFQKTVERERARAAAELAALGARAPAALRAREERLAALRFASPQLTSRFTGLDAAAAGDDPEQEAETRRNSRQMVTFEYALEPDPEFGYECEIRPAGLARQAEDVAILNSGRETTREERRAAHARRGSLRGVRGNLFCSSVWLEHAKKSLLERGLARSENDPLLRATAESLSLAGARIAEVVEEPGFECTPVKDVTFSALEKKDAPQAPQEEEQLDDYMEEEDAVDRMFADDED